MLVDFILLLLEILFTFLDDLFRHRKTTSKLRSKVSGRRAMRSESQE